MLPSTTPNQKLTTSKPEIVASRDLQVYAVEDCGATIKLHWVALDNGEKGYTEMARQVAIDRGVVLPQMTGFFETINAINEENEQKAANRGGHQEGDRRSLEQSTGD